MTACEIPLGDLRPAIFIRRVNRFVALVQIGGREELVHVPSSGRMQELLVNGAGVYLAPGRGRQRKTNYSLSLACSGDILVSVDSLLPNRLIRFALEERILPELGSYNEVCSEYKYEQSRFDFFLPGNGHGCFVEVKSVTLVENGAAKFPDAPSGRGLRHVKELIKAREKGFAAVVIFVVQREDGLFFTPHKVRDPAFAAALAEAVSAGVTVCAYSCIVSPEKAKLDRRLPVHI